jgi:hypothetical protein
VESLGEAGAIERGTKHYVEKYTLSSTGVVRGKYRRKGAALHRLPHQEMFRQFDTN